MIKFVAIAALVLSGDFSSAKPIPEDQLSHYRRAIMMSVNQQEWICSQSNPTLGVLDRESFEIIINFSTYASVSMLGEQPLFMFVLEDQTSKSVATLHTSEDYTRIERMGYRIQKYTEVYEGNLLEPRFVRVFKGESFGSCSPRQ